MAETVEVYGREYEISKPKTRHYLDALQFVKRLVQEGHAHTLVELSDSDEMGALEFLLELIDAIDESHLAHLAAVLLQADVDETVVWIEENGGVELGWLMEAFAVNCELADLGQVVESFRRAQTAVRGWRAEAG